MLNNQEQKKVLFQLKWYKEIKAYSEYSGETIANLLTKLWKTSKERKDFIGNGKNGTEIIQDNRRN
mgnify:CR=1 FL=1